MLEQRTNNLKEKLKEQINLAKYQINIGGFNNVMYGFVEIIENDPVFSKFVKAKIDQELDMKDLILKERKAGNINEEEKQRLIDIHLKDSFWTHHYCVFKQAHDIIKIDKCEALGIIADNICRSQVFWYMQDERNYGKKLSEEKIQEYIYDFEKCYNILVGLINSDQKLLNEINDEYLKVNFLNENEEQEKKEIEASYNDNSKRLFLNYKDEKISFEGRRALIVLFFYKNEGDKTFHDFNAWLKNEKIKEKNITSPLFRQEMSEINRRFQKKSKYISSIINYANKDRKNNTKINIYKFKIILK